ncbi:MAG: pseudouridine synthase [Oceanisphaera sp.]|uniref:pseudouridine synthase n=1 Tax=Oceanisphaera sp. TaxID=1929979 RepID=UPI003F9C34B7
MRLDRFLSEATGMTRSQAKKALHSGEVTVEGEITKKSSEQIKEQMVCLNGQPLKRPSDRYILLHKPTGYISATQDEVHPCVLQLLPTELRRGMQCAGRLDLDTTGALLLTDDGQWSHRLRSPKKACSKVYQVDLSNPLTSAEAADITERFAQGVQLNGEEQLTLPAQLVVLTPTRVLLTLQEGKYHQVKRMFSAIGNHVVGLHRLQVGDIQLGSDLAEGEWRHLTPEEVASI